MDALTAARLAEASYQAEPTFRFGPVCRMWVSEVEDGVALVFPGTRPDHPGDDFADLDVGPLSVEPDKLVHAGFWREGQMAFPTVVRLARQKPIHLIGHSLGAGAVGAVATMCATAGVPVASVWGFGCPRTAVGRWQAAMLAAAGIPVRLLRNGGDLVTRLPMHVDNAALPGALRHLAHAVLPFVGDWDVYGVEAQISGSRSDPLNLRDHAIGAYVAALEAKFNADSTRHFGGLL